MANKQNMLYFTKIREIQIKTMRFPTPPLVYVAKI